MFATNICKFDQNRAKFVVVFVVVLEMYDIVNTFARCQSDFTKSAACKHVFARNMCKNDQNRAKFVVAAAVVVVLKT